jgi:MOSC domain-containing protein YiiM
VKLISVNVGQLRAVVYRDALVQTGIFKSAVPGRVRVGRERLDGDAQADLTVHGGPEKAVYVYPAEHYSFWRRELPDADLPWGAFGENLTTEGVLERDVHAGDRVRIGSAEFVVTRPRMPCFKLGIRFGRADIIKRFWLSGRSGFYLAIAAAGVLEAGDAVTVQTLDSSAPSVAEVFSGAAAGHDAD